MPNASRYLEPVRALGLGISPLRIHGRDVGLEKAELWAWRGVAEALGRWPGVRCWVGMPLGVRLFPARGHDRLSWDGWV